MHKPRGPNSLPPFRPIVSSIGTYNYELAKYLCSLLQPNIPTNCCTQDSFTFVNEIQDIPLSSNFMVSFDVESLFTNIPLNECIDLAVRYIKEDNTDIKLSATELKTLLRFATSQTHFLFKGSFYDQVDGVSMGSPLAPVLANLFMGHNEKDWIENYKGSKILFYRRYVDDTFCVFEREEDAVSFYNYINSQHPNIRFTMEKEVDNKLAFLDVLVNNNPPNLQTSVFRKKTFTGLLTNYFSFTSFSYKMGLVRTLVDRVYKINNSWLGFHKDIKHLTLILRKNLFPVDIVEKVINRYVSRATSRPSASAQVQQAVSTYYFKLPYVGSFTRETQKRLRKLVQRYCTNIEIKLAFSSFKIGRMFSVKDPFPLDLRSRVVYKFTCAGCNACYIGETSRHLSTRVREHLSRDRNSHIFQHLQQSQACRCLADKTCFSIVDCAPNKLQLLLKEAMHIKWENPTLNKQLKHADLSLSF